MKNLSSGFTIAELMVAVILAILLFTTLAAFYAGGFNYQSQQVTRVAITNRSLGALRAIQQQVEQASLLGGCPNNTAQTFIFGGINVRPDNGAPLNNDPNQPQQYFYFCVDNAHPTLSVCAPAAAPCPALILYTGPWPPPGIAVPGGPCTPGGSPSWPPAPAIVCGGPAPGGSYENILAAPLENPGGVGGAVVPFTRPTRFNGVVNVPINDVVHVDFSVHLNAANFTNTQNAQGLLDVNAPVQVDVRARVAANP